MNIYKIAKYETDTCFFFLDSINLKKKSIIILSYCPIFKRNGSKVTVGELRKDTKTYPSNVSRAKIEKDIKEISGCETFKILLYDKTKQKYKNDEE